MKQGDFVEIEFVGRIAATGEIFDLTSEETAKKEGIYDPKQKYGPALVIIGSRMTIPGMEKELLRMKPGEQREFTVTPQEGFGFRNPGLVKIISIANFARQKINPVPGMFVTIDNRQARVQSVSGGRVRVDFNNPLAGKELVYSVKIVRQITAAKEKVTSLLKYYGLDFQAEMEKDKLILTSEKPLPEPLQKMLRENITKWIKEIKAVEFVSREKPEKTAQATPLSQKHVPKSGKPSSGQTSTSG